MSPEIRFKARMPGWGLGRPDTLETLWFRKSADWYTDCQFPWKHKMSNISRSRRLRTIWLNFRDPFFQQADRVDSSCCRSTLDKRFSCALAPTTAVGYWFTIHFLSVTDGQLDTSTYNFSHHFLSLVLLVGYQQILQISITIDQYGKDSIEKRPIAY